MQERLEAEVMDLSNKTLAFILVAAIVISLGGTLLSLDRLNRLGFTGQASTDTGTTNFTLTTDLNIIFRVTNIDLGTGYINASGGNSGWCVLGTNVTQNYLDCLNFTTNNNPLILENIGNINASIGLHTNASAAEFIGGTVPAAPQFNWSVINNESGSCLGTLPNASWSPVNKTGDIVVCTNMNSAANSSSNNSLKIFVQIGVPRDALRVAHAAQIIATATQ
jgi:hypothetical protein